MTLTQFQVRYPTASLISELLTIYQGKFVVRVAVQIDGVTRATGMAAAETVEEAEDKARSRAITAIAIDQTPAPLTAAAAIPEPSLSKPFSSEAVQQHLNPSQPLTTPEPLLELNYASVSPSPPTESKSAIASALGVKGKSKRSTVTPEQLEPEEDVFGEFGMIADPKTATTESMNLTTTPASNVTPLVPRSPGSPAKTSAKAGHQTSEPIDLSDVLAKTDVELERLKWTKEQGRDHLINTYSKRSRSLLTEQELLEFLYYLESQPTPI